jgi:hypothetical protein
MANAVSIGQLTITDQNDAKPISVYLQSNGANTQFFLDDQTDSYSPNWSATPIKWSATVYVGNITNNVYICTSKIFSIAGSAIAQDGAWITGGSVRDAVIAAYFTAGTTMQLTNAAGDVSLQITGNLKPTANTVQIMFSCTYTDAITTLSQPVFRQETMGVNTKGISPVYAEIKGPSVILKSASVTAGSAILYADLMRTSTGVADNTAGTTYMWYKQPYGTTDLLDYNHPDVAAGYFGFADTAAYLNGKMPVKNKLVTSAAGTQSAIAVGNMPDGIAGDYKAIYVTEDAITDIQTLKCTIKSPNDAVSYSAFQTIEDGSDQWVTEVISSCGKSMLPSTTTARLTPRIYTGSYWVTDFTGYKYTWQITNRDGKQAFFIDASKTSGQNGTLVSFNTSGSASVAASFTIGTAFTPGLALGDIVKCYRADGTEAFYEVQASSTTTVNLRITGNIQGISSADYPWPIANEFVRMYQCKTDNPAVKCVVTTTAVGSANPYLDIYGADIDGLGNIICNTFAPAKTA